MRTSIILVSTAFVASAAALGPVSNSDQLTWCQGQKVACPNLCGGNFANNTCIAYSGTALPVYNCTCTDGTVPNLASYAQTIPTFECLEQFKECIAGNQTDQAAQNQCTEAKKNCGTLDSTKLQSVTSSSTSTSSATTSPTAASTTSAAPAATTSAKSMAFSAGEHLGLGVFAISAMAIFGMLL